MYIGEKSDPRHSTFRDCREIADERAAAAGGQSYDDQEEDEEEKDRYQDQDEEDEEEEEDVPIVKFGNLKMSPRPVEKDSIARFQVSKNRLTEFKQQLAMISINASCPPPCD